MTMIISTRDTLKLATNYYVTWLPAPAFLSFPMHPLAVELFFILAWMTGASIAQQSWCVKPK
jgi:hypothetical protein